MTLLMTSLAWADNVRNDVVVGGNDTFTAGGSATVNYSIQATPPTSCDAADGSAATVTINAPSGVTATPGSRTFSSCGTSQSVVFTSTTPGDYEITVSVADTNGSYTESPAKFTLHVLTPPTPADTTPPVITANVSGTPGDNGWYVSDVLVSWDVTDAESTISSTTDCGPTTISADTSGTTLTCSATSAGGTASNSVTINRDATVPTISGSASPAANGADWNNTDVEVAFACADATSGIASCGPDQTLSSEGVGLSASGTAIDNAGNSAGATVPGINIDKTDPVVAVTGVANGAIYTLGSVPAAGCDTTDALSGVAVHATVSITGGPVGSVTATCEGAKDNADNTGAASATYSVVYDWTGLFRPVDNMPTLNQVKAGSAIPIKFSLGGNQGLSIMATGFPKSTPITCDTTAQVDGIEETLTAGGSSLSYDPIADQYVYVWKTDKTWSGCRQLSVKLIDGTTHSANFKFTK